VLRLLRWLARPAGLVVVLEDLHWADPDTLAADEFGQARALAYSVLDMTETEARAEARCHALEIVGRSERPRDLAAAKDAFERALAIAEAHGLPFWRLRALHELGTIELYRNNGTDRLSQARQQAEELGAMSTAAVLDLHWPPPPTAAMTWTSWPAMHANPCRSASGSAWRRCAPRRWSSSSRAAPCAATVRGPNSTRRRCWPRRAATGWTRRSSGARAGRCWRCCATTRAFAAHGIQRLARRCEERLGGVVPPSWASLGVTAREADVLRLVAEGLANKEIAIRLYLSPRTVEKHVENLLRKTGARSRTQLVALLPGQGPSWWPC
jgi:DNA-binding CsgD family transcriptional regulator